MRKDKNETFDLNEHGDFFAVEVECEGESRRRKGGNKMKKSHEKMMEKAWATIESCRITEDPAQYEADNEMYLVDDIHKVRDALYSDMEQGIEIEGEDIDGFFARHGISYK